MGTLEVCARREPWLAPGGTGLRGFLASPGSRHCSLSLSGCPRGATPLPRARHSLQQHKPSASGTSTEKHTRKIKIWPFLKVA